MSEWWRKLQAMFRRKVIDAELEEEMRTHLAMKTSGASDPSASRRQFGNVALLLEDSRAIWGWPRLETWLRDFRYALRALGRNLPFTATVVLTLALGIGASSTIFTLINTVLIRPLSYPDSERLVAIFEAKSDQISRTPVAPGRLEDWQRLAGAFDGVAGSHTDSLIDTTSHVPERLFAAFTSPRFFSVLGVRPALGRVFTNQEEGFGGPLAVVISDGLWRRRFASNPGVLGSTLRLSDQTYTIVGVMPPTFQYPAADVEIWVPKQARPTLLAVREARFYRGVARLKQGTSLEQAQMDLRSVQKRLGEQYPATDAGWSVVVAPLKEELVGKVRLALWLMLGSVGALLIIACANVACLLLARLNSRSAEIATRRALGAGRGAIMRQLFVEGLAYALVGGILGVGMALAGIDALRKQLPDIPRIGELAADASMIGYAAAISVLAAVLLSLAPIFQTLRRDVAASLIRGGTRLIGTRERLPRFLVSAQLALATALLISAGLFMRSLVRVQNEPLGFSPDHVLTLRVTASFAESPEAAVQRHQRMLDGLASVPGVTAVAMTSGLPGVSPTWPREFDIAGDPPADGALRFGNWRIVTDGYFQTVGISLLEGRSCRMSTDPQTPFEILVNRSFAQRYFRGRGAIGQTIVGGPGITRAFIVGVVADAREDGPFTDSQPVIYACGFLRFWPDSEVLIQTANPQTLANAVREKLRQLEPSRPIYSLRPMPEALAGALAQTRFRTLLVSLFSIMALTLAAVGLYGVMAYMVSQRRREIGIRIALGARPAQVIGEILRSGAALAGSGAIVGMGLAAAASSWMRALLYGIRPSDMTTYVYATGLLFAVAWIACLIPSKRATSIDPTEALRAQ